VKNGRKSARENERDRESETDREKGERQRETK